MIIASAGLLGSTWANTAQAQTSSATPPRAATATKDEASEGFDALIRHLHAEFKITPAQEELWQKVVDVMRENADVMSKLAKTRSGSANTMTAVDDLKSYS